MPFKKILIDQGAVVNILLYKRLEKLGKTKTDLIPTELTVSNFAGTITATHGILIAELEVSSKNLMVSYLVVDITSSYHALMGRDWIHQNYFAWHYHEMLGLNRDLAKHLKRKMSIETDLKVKEEIERLLKAWFIRPARYVEWLANIVHVLKKIAKVMRYNQIMVAEKGIKKIAFRYPSAIGAYEYVVKPFELKNAVATNQRATNAIFHDMIRHTLEVYIDDVVIKSQEKAEHVENLRKPFTRMRKYQLKINPKKCAFRIGIEVEKNKAKDRCTNPKKQERIAKSA
ncbi:unnamed protein product [Prunus armeniaca]